MRTLRIALSLCLAVVAATVAHADTMTYDITYAGTSTYGGGTVIGNGYFTYSYTPGDTTGTLTGFYFTDTITNATYGTSTFTYNGVSSVKSSSIVTSNLSPYGLTNITLQTDYLTGTNSAFGPVDFVLNYSPVVYDSTGGTNAAAADYYGDFSSGSGTVTLAPPSATPEPSSLALLGTAILGAAVFLRRRFA